MPTLWLQPEGATEWKPLRAYPEFSSALGFNPGHPANHRAQPAARLLWPADQRPGPDGHDHGHPRRDGRMDLLPPARSFSILGIIFSCVGLSQINQNPAQYTGKGMAIAGIILSALGLVMHFFFAILFGLFGAFARVLGGIH